jgi:hypothetical protein
MIRGRWGHGCYLFDRVIYIFGGNGTVKSAEKYELSGRENLAIADMPVGLSWLSVADYKQELYLAGFGSPHIFIYDLYCNTYTQTSISLINTGTSATDYASLCFYG